MTDELVKRLADLDPILETDFDTQIGVERDPYGATKAIEAALYLLRDQADRIEALQADLKALRDAIAIKGGNEHSPTQDAYDAACAALQLHRERADKAEADNAQLLKALTFYADEENYRGYIHTDACGCCSSWYEPKIHIDGEDSGNIARAAIAALNTGKADT